MRNLLKIVLLLTSTLSATAVGTALLGVFNPSSLWYLGFLVICLGATWLLVGFRPRRDVSGLPATQIVVIYVLSYLVLIYLLGLVTGFLRNSYSLAPLMILQNVLPVIGITIATELLRYALVKRIGQHKWAFFGVIFTFSALTIMVGLPSYGLNAPLEIFEMIGRLILGGIAVNVLLTFVAYKSDFRPTLTYALIMAVYPLVAPIIPDLGPFIYSVLAIMLPTLLFVRFNEYFLTKRPIPSYYNRWGRILIVAPTVAALAVVVVLVSGIFRYLAMAIGSDSMKPEINVGDVVVIDKDYGETKDIEPCSVIAFRHDGKVIAHRLIEIKNSANGPQLQTKGDGNKTNDMWLVGEDDMVGVVRLKVPIIGWPTVWLDRTI